jgi:hypothetical protein
VARKLQENGFIPVAMEDFEADDLPPIDSDKRRVELCDIYVGIFAWRYGNPAPVGNASFTEAEYRNAHNLGLPCLIFLTENGIAWPEDQKDDDQKPIKRLRDELSRDHLMNTFREPGQLAVKCLAAVKAHEYHSTIYISCDAEDHGWAKKMGARLEPFLRSRLPIKFNIVYSAGVSDKLAPAEQCAAFVSVVSRDYVTSAECAAELSQPKRQVKSILGIQRGHVARRSLPAPLNHVRLICPQKSEVVEEFALLGLANQIRDQIKNRRGEDGAVRKSVFLADVSSDLRREREIVRRYLEDNGFKVVPATYLPSERAEFEEAVRSEMKDVSLVVRLLSESNDYAYLEYPDGWMEILKTIQSELKKKDENWMKPRQAAEVPQETLATKVDPYKAVEDNLSIFNKSLLIYFKEEDERIKDPPQVFPHSSIFVTSPVTDRKNVVPFCRTCLRGRDAYWIPSDLDQKKARKRREILLSSCRTIYVLYFESDSEEVLTECMRCNEELIQLLGDPKDPIYAVAHPAPKDDLGSNRIEIVSLDQVCTNRDEPCCRTSEAPE